MDLIERLRLLEQDHESDGWPAVRMRDITALLDALEALRAEVERLTDCLAAANVNHEKFERRWYLEKDCAERLAEALAGLVSAVSWERHGECRSPGWPGPPPKVTDALEEARAAIALAQGDAA